VEQRGIEPLTSALRTAKLAFSWTTFSALKITLFAKTLNKKRSREQDLDYYES